MAFGTDLTDHPNRGLLTSTTRYHNPEDKELCPYRRENVTSFTNYGYFLTPSLTN